MNRKSPPSEVTLRKSPSGTWEAADTRPRRFKPWQRLWLVAGAVYLLMLAGSFYMLVPNRERIERQMVYSVTEEVRRYDGMAFVGESPREIFERARSEGYAAWIARLRATYRIGAGGNAAFDRIDTACRDAVAGLPVKRTLGILICAVAWLVPMALLYAMGSVVEWIKRGSRVIRM